MSRCRQDDKPIHRRRRWASVRKRCPISTSRNYTDRAHFPRAHAARLSHPTSRSRNDDGDIRDRTAGLLAACGAVGRYLNGGSMEMWDRVDTSHGRRHLRSHHLPTGHSPFHGRVPFLAQKFRSCRTARVGHNYHRLDRLSLYYWCWTHPAVCTTEIIAEINQSINFYLLKMSRDTHKRLFNCEQDNKAETNTNSCPTNKLWKKRKKTQHVQNSLRWRTHTLYQVFLKLITVTKIQWIEYNSMYS